MFSDTELESDMRTEATAKFEHEGEVSDIDAFLTSANGTDATQQNLAVAAHLDRPAVPTVRSDEHSICQK